MFKKRLLGIIFISAVAVLTGCAILDPGGADFYSFGGDKIPSIKGVVNRRQVEKVQKGTKDGIAYLEYEYTSMTVLSDLVAYLNYMRDEDGWQVTRAYDLADMPGSAEISKTSAEEGKILIMAIDYTKEGYTIGITKAPGQLEPTYWDPQWE